MHSKSKVYFFFDSVRVSLGEHERVKRMIETIFKKEGKTLESLNYVFCSDKRLKEINKQYLNHDYFTDIITFDLSSSKAITGEVYISVDRVRENARQLGIPVRNEFKRVIFHGALHLCGYKDKSKSDVGKMRAREDYYLERGM